MASMLEARVDVMQTQQTSDLQQIGSCFTLLLHHCCPCIQSSTASESSRSSLLHGSRHCPNEAPTFRCFSQQGAKINIGSMPETSQTYTMRVLLKCQWRLETMTAFGKLWSTCFKAELQCCTCAPQVHADDSIP